MHLNEPEVLIALILENLRKESNIVLLPDVSLGSIDDRCGPFDDERLESILLVEIGVHVLFESFSPNFSLLALPIELLLLSIHVCDCILQLFESEHPILNPSNRRGRAFLFWSMSLWASSPCSLGRSLCILLSAILTDFTAT